jgi:hypothetical protein
VTLSGSESEQENTENITADTLGNIMYRNRSEKNTYRRKSLDKSISDVLDSVEVDALNSDLDMRQCAMYMQARSSRTMRG